MKPLYIYFLVASVIILSILFAVGFGSNDILSLGITSLGSFGTIATLIIAYQIFITYNAAGDVQKKRFELVDKALAFYLTKRFYAFTGKNDFNYLYNTKQRLDLFLNVLKEDDLDSQSVIISRKFLEFLLDFQNYIEHHYFPIDIKMKILSNLPQSLIMLPDKIYDNKIRIDFNNESDDFGYPIMSNEKVSIKEFIESLNTIRIIMIDYLNKNVSKKYRIIDAEI